MANFFCIFLSTENMPQDEHSLLVLMTFAIALAVALFFGFIAYHLKLSPIVGYLLAGITLGFFTSDFINEGIAEDFSKIGVILLLFGIGLRFHLRELFAVWRIAVPGSLIQSAMSTIALMLLLHFLGWTWVQSLLVGMAISVASTVVMALVLAERHDLHSQIGHIAFGWTVVEDILSVAMLVLMPIIFPTGDTQQTHTNAGAALGLAGLKIIGLVAIVIILGRWVIPYVLEKIAKTRSRELFTLAVLILAVGIASSSSKFFGVSMELGAFLAGLAVGRSEFSLRAASDAVPMRDAFAVLFFVAVGMLFNPASLIESPHLIYIVLVVVVVIKPICALVTVLMLGKPLSVAIPVGAAFSQIGEFSFIIGTMAKNHGLIPPVAYDALVAVSIISIALNPSIYRLLRRASSQVVHTQLDPSKSQIIDPKHCILVGYGPVGQIVYRLLSERGATITIIDLNLETIRRLRSTGFSALYGDVLRHGILEEAGIATAGSLILSADVEDAAEIIRKARQLNPGLRVLVRCTHLRDSAKLISYGADVVAAGEAEVGVALAEAVVAHEQIDVAVAAKQREEIRRNLYSMAKFV